MSGRSRRTQVCDRIRARIRLADAEAQLVLAGLADAAGSPEDRKAAAACAVVAGIAAADAACCAALRRRSRSDDHRGAADLLRLIEPGGDVAAKQLGRLIGLKDAAQYGFDDIPGPMFVAARRQAGSLVEFAVHVLDR